MGNTSYTLAYTALFTALTSNQTTGAPHANLTGVTRVYKYEPKVGNLLKPVSVTIMPNGTSETYYTFMLRIYASLEETPELGAAALVTAIDQVDAQIKAAGIDAGPGKFDVGYVSDADVLVARADIAIGREDF